MLEVRCYSDRVVISQDGFNFEIKDSEFRTFWTDLRGLESVMGGPSETVLNRAVTALKGAKKEPSEESLGNSICRILKFLPNTPEGVLLNEVIALRNDAEAYRKLKDGTATATLGPPIESYSVLVSNSPEEIAAGVVQGFAAVKANHYALPLTDEELKCYEAALAKVKSLLTAKG